MKMPRSKPSGALFTLVVGVLIGVLATMLTTPDNEVVVRQGAGDLEALPWARPGGGAADATGAGGAGPDTAPIPGLVDEGGQETAPKPGADPASGGAPGPLPAGGGSQPVPDGGTTPADGDVAAPAGVSRGVTSDAIKIGVALLDLGPVAALGPRFDNGDPQKQFEAILDRWKREGVFPVHGRSIQFVYRTYSALSPAEEREACVALVKDEKVFMVIGQLFFYTGSECVAREFKTPLLTSDGPSDEVFERSHPFLFSLQMSTSRMMRNWVHWAHDRDALRGKKIGIYYAADEAQAELVRDMKTELRRLGYRVAAEATTNSPRGGPEDAIAVQRFRSADVDLAMLLTSKAGFMQQAEAQLYRPKYIETDFEFGTSDTAASLYPPDHFNGTFGMTGRRVGETSAGIRPPAEAEVCLAAYERYAGRRPAEESTEWSYILTACDEAKVVLIAIQAAGRNLTHATFIAGLETVKQVQVTRFADVTFTPQKHHGGDTQRTVQWQKACSCWKVVGDWKPLFVA